LITAASLLGLLPVAVDKRARLTRRSGVPHRTVPDFVPCFDLSTNVLFYYLTSASVPSCLWRSPRAPPPCGQPTDSPAAFCLDQWPL